MLNIRPQTIRILEENLRNTILVIDGGKKIMTKSSKATATKIKINKLDLIKVKTLCTAKETIKLQTTEWEKTFADYASKKGLISRICKELKTIQPDNCKNQ